LLAARTAVVVALSVAAAALSFSAPVGATARSASDGMAASPLSPSASMPHVKMAEETGGQLIGIKAINSPCVDVVFVGARGSGADAIDHLGMGPEIWSALMAYADRVTDRRIGYWGVTYPAHAVESLVGLGNRARYFRGLDDGVIEVVQLLRKREVMCPRERYVLAGYSQGAMVAHRALWRLRDLGFPLRRIDGVIAVADGDRVANQGGRHLGSAPASGLGVTWIFDKVSGALATGAVRPRDTPVPAAMDGQRAGWFISVCLNGDLVCDTDLEHPLRGLSLHTQYVRHQAVVGDRGAAAIAARRTMTFPAVAPMRFTQNDPPLAVLNEPYEYQFAAAGGVGAYTFRVPSLLPPGLTLSAKGRLKGSLSSVNIDERAIFTLLAEDSVGQTIKTRVIINESETPPPPPTDGPWKSIDAGRQFTCGIKHDATMWCFGRSAHMVGSEPTDSALPLKVSNRTDWVSVSVGGWEACAVNAGGALWCWHLMLDPSFNTSDVRYVMSPERVGTDRDWRSVSSGDLHFCAIKQSGTLWCWGDGTLGQTGLGDAAPTTTSPTQVGLDTDWAVVSAGWSNTCATKTDQTLWCWGYNGNGELGDGTFETRYTPVQVGAAWDWVDVSVGYRAICAITTSSAQACWDYYQTNVILPSGFAASVSEGAGIRCGIAIDATAWCRGYNNDGAVGVGIFGGDYTDRNYPIASNETFAQVTVGQEFACGLAESGHAYCWGRNLYGELGDGTQINQNKPTLVIE
jgi:alpha-tubulin suppressor-like RCC1 family protein